MQLKSIELQGFKSFPDKTTLTFDSDITAVVGPNGSGKSNISDAVKWVFGEQSVKSLRGGKMEDVIFGGTQLRKAMGYASVTVTLDNADRQFACDSDLVSITRRLYRSGESEYRINGAAVRLKDIHELLMDTGLGRDGYSMVGQGRIADLISAKSRDRREIFDEAAGISKFRYRKAEAERRLMQAEENMLRLRDIFAEIESQLAPLEEESRKANEFLRLSEAQKVLEVSIWVDSLSTMAAQLADLDEAVFSTTRLIEDSERTLEALGQSEEQNAAELRAVQLEIEQNRTRMAEAAERLSALEAQCAVLENDRRHNERSIAEAEAALRLGREGRAEAEAELAEARALLSDREAERDAIAAALTEIEAELDALLKEQQQNAAELDALRLRRSGLFEIIETKRRAASATTAIIDESTHRIETLGQIIREREAALSQLSRDMAALEKEIAEDREELSGLENAKKGYLLKRQGRLARREKLEAEHRRIEGEAAQKRQRAGLLTDMQKNLEGFAPGVKYIMTQQQRGLLSGVHGPISSLITVPDRYAIALEVALGAATGNLVVEDETVAKRAIGMLTGAKVGRATFLPLTSVKGRVMDAADFARMPGFVGVASQLVECDSAYAGIVAQLLGRVVVAENLDSAQAMAKKSGYRQRVVTLDGQVINAGGSYTGGYLARSTGIFSRAGEIETLLAEADALTEQLKASQGALDESRRELAELDTALTDIDADIRSLSGDLIRAEAELEQYRRSLGMAQQSLAAAQKEQQEQADRVDQLKSVSATDSQLVAESDAQLEAVQQQIETLSNLRDALNARHMATSGRISSQSAALAIARSQVETAEEAIARIEQALSSGESRQEELSRRIASLEEENRRLDHTRTELTAAQTDVRAASAEAQSRITELFERQSACESKATELREKERSLLSDKEGLIRRLSHSQERRDALADQKTQIIAKLWESYEMTLTDAEALAQPVENRSADNRRLADLRSRIRALGHVNLGAIEAYRALSERHSFLSAQMADVEKSRRELTRLIGDLSRDMRELFSEKFAQIGEHFSRIFVDLFDGGKARLALTDPSDILESGIEIEVQPPGKLIKNLSALSGGEQAFVAIAIFLAILKVNPAPFCLFDEIEAALDEVNVNKFAAYLRKFTHDTQFILITHRRGTMEEADVLYGVAMQEEGVSKLLRLSLSEAQELTALKPQTVQV
jgi:chromosome segregation protein